jgi:phage shock protein PspC (stress-responsive transcriptional regulator)
MKKVAEKYNVDPITLRRAIEKLGIIFNKGKSEYLTRELITKEYNDIGTAGGVARKLGVDDHTIKRYLIKYGLIR